MHFRYPPKADVNSPPWFRRLVPIQTLAGLFGNVVRRTSKVKGIVSIPRQSRGL